MSEIILRERVIVIGAGDAFDQALQGNVLRVTSGSVPLRVQSRDNQMDFTLLAGERAEFPGEFPGLILSHNSPTDQAFTIQVGKGVAVASALVNGSVSITGGIIDTVTNLVGIANDVRTIDNGFDYGGAYAGVTGIAANTAVPVITPAANQNGAIVYSASLFGYNNANAPIVSLVAKTSAPTSITDGNVLLLTENATAGGYACGRLSSAIKVPPGRGVYVISNVVNLSSTNNVVYKIL